MYELPLPSERWHTTISVDGIATDGFSDLILSSSHLEMLAEKMSATIGPVRRIVPVKPGMLYSITTAAITEGKWRIFPGASASWASVRGASLAPTSTVRFESIRIPPPDPIDW